LTLNILFIMANVTFRPVGRISNIGVNSGGCHDPRILEWQTWKSQGIVGLRIIIICYNVQELDMKTAIVV